MAIKRIPDVLASPDQAKRVLREVAILRRLAHPNVISLRDAFTRPSATGTQQEREETWECMPPLDSDNRTHEGQKRVK